MIPKSNLYKHTTVDMVKTMIEVSKLLQKFGIIEKRLTQQGTENNFFEFIIRKDNNTSLLIKIKIPHIEKQNRHNTEYDESRSYRYFYHYLKALLSAKEAEIYSLEEIFMAHIVMALPSGQTITLGEQLTKQLEEGHAPALEGFNVVPSEPSRQIEEKKQTLRMITSDDEKQ